MSQLLQKLASHEVFSGLSSDELESISDIVDRRAFHKGERLYDTSRIPNFIFYIESGSFELILSTNAQITLEPGKMIGEIGVINGDFRSGTATALEASSVIAICGTRLFQEKFVEPRVALKIVRALSKQITSYLRSKEQISTRELLDEGESDQVEFKSSLRWNNHIDKKDKAIENASLKTIAAFLNTAGGTLFIGVADDSTILGLEADRFENQDKLLLHITTLMNDRISPIHIKYVHLSIEKIEGKEILRVDCKPAKSPSYLDDGKREHFYIRTGPATTDLAVSQVYPYIKQRFYLSEEN